MCENDLERDRAVCGGSSAGGRDDALRKRCCIGIQGRELRVNGGDGSCDDGNSGTSGAEGGSVEW